jgi:hypothetical protein
VSTEPPPVCVETIPLGTFAPAAAIFSDEDIEPEGRYTGKEKETIARAKALGFGVVRSDHDHLLLDLDNGDAVNRFNDLIQMFDAKFGVAEVQWWHSKSGWPHTHVSVKTKNGMSAKVRVGLEMALGSDQKRGMLNYAKLADQPNVEPSLLFVPPGALVTVISGPPWTLVTHKWTPVTP